MTCAAAEHTDQCQSQDGTSRTQKPSELEGFYEYRHGDSNPGFRRERAVS